MKQQKTNYVVPEAEIVLLTLEGVMAGSSLSDYEVNSIYQEDFD